MSKNLFLIGASAALLLGSCAQSEDYEPAVKNEQVPVTFRTYIGRSAVTKAAQKGELTSANLKNFGVFSSYGDAADPDKTPDFMYNEQITGTSGSWAYADAALTKYWPNEVANGNVDSQTPPATSTGGADKLNFWAYAPYVKVKAGEEANGTLDETATEGITALSKNTETPAVSYTVAKKPEDNVDLCYGVANFDSWTNVAGTTTSFTKGTDFITGLTKPAVGTPVAILFKHALSKLSIEAATSVSKDNNPTGAVQTETKVTIEKIEVTSEETFSQSGVLDLTTGKWTASGTAEKLNLTIEGDALNATFKDSGSDEVQTVAGVLGTYQTVYKDATTSLMLIPDDTEKSINVTITYYVTTPDSKLQKGYSRVKNVIKKSATNKIKFEQSKKYTLKLTLGLADVQLTATVDDWTNGTEEVIHLPKNN